jgi:hypothetical protein
MTRAFGKLASLHGRQTEARRQSRSRADAPLLRAEEGLRLDVFLLLLPLHMRYSACCLDHPDEQSGRRAKARARFLLIESVNISAPYRCCRRPAPNRDAKGVSVCGRTGKGGGATKHWPGAVRGLPSLVVRSRCPSILSFIRSAPRRASSFRRSRSSSSRSFSAVPVVGRDVTVPTDALCR